MYAWVCSICYMCRICRCTYVCTCISIWPFDGVDHEGYGFASKERIGLSYKHFFYFNPLDHTDCQRYFVKRSWLNWINFIPVVCSEPSSTNFSLCMVLSELSDFLFELTNVRLRQSMPQENLMIILYKWDLFIYLGLLLLMFSVLWHVQTSNGSTLLDVELLP